MRLLGAGATDTLVAGKPHAVVLRMVPGYVCSWKRAGRSKLGMVGFHDPLQGLFYSMIVLM
jgi:hypothetical protein